MRLNLSPTALVMNIRVLLLTIATLLSALTAQAGTAYINAPSSSCHGAPFSGGTITGASATVESYYGTPGCGVMHNYTISATAMNPPSVPAGCPANWTMRCFFMVSGSCNLFQQIDGTSLNVTIQGVQDTTVTLAFCCVVLDGNGNTVSGYAESTPVQIMLPVGPTSVSTCSIDSIEVTQGTCDNNGTATTSDDFHMGSVTVLFSDKPSSGYLMISGLALLGGSVSVPVENTFYGNYTFNGVALRANGASEILTAQFVGGSNSCDLSAYAPAVQCAACSVDSIAVGPAGPCNVNGTPNVITDDYITADVTVQLTAPSDTGSLQLTGDAIASGTYTVSAYPNFPASFTFSGVRLKADGFTHGLSASFTSNPACTQSITTPAYPYCSTPPVCSISQLTATTGTCNNNGTASDVNDDFFLSTIVVTFLNKPSTGALELIGAAVDPSNTPAVGVSFTSTNTTHTFTNVKLRANGVGNTLTARFSATPACTASIIAANVPACSIPPCPGAYTLMPGEQYLLTADPGLLSYLWTKDGNPIAGATSQTYTVTTPGVYNWAALTAAGCAMQGRCPITFNAPPLIYDFSDWSGNGSINAYATVIAGLRLGGSVDRELAATTNSDASGDDITGIDDEELSLPALDVGQPNELTVTVTNDTLQPAYLRGYFDQNGNGAFESNELVINDTFLAGSGMSPRNYTITPNNTGNNRGLRFIVTSNSTPVIVGNVGNGEVEDYTVNVVCPTLSVTPLDLDDPVIGQSYVQAVPFNVTGGTAPYTWGTPTGVPPGMIWNASSRTLSGIPTNTTTGNTFSLTVTDSKGCTGNVSFPFNSQCPTLTIGPSFLPLAYTGQSYYAQLTVDGGVGPYTWSLIGGSWPNGISMDSATGVISGTAPNTPITIPVTVQVTDSRGCTGQSQGLACVVFSVTLGNKIWHDQNCNGLFDGGEPGIGGISVRLMNRGPDGIAYTTDDQTVTTDTTDGSGNYQFTNLIPGGYYVRFSPPTTFPLATVNPVNLDNGVDNDSNAIQSISGGAIRSPVINLAANGEPTVDDGLDSTDLTVDFGLRPPFCVGDLVWSDLNNNGLKDPDETGIPGISVTLMSPGPNGAVGGGDDITILTTTTSSTGAYKFLVPLSGTFFVRILPTAAYQVPSGPVFTIDNGINNDNNGSQPGGAETVITSYVFTLAACREPGLNGGGSNETTIDFGLVPNLMALGNLVFEDRNSNDRYDTGEGVDGVTVQLYASNKIPGTDNPLQTTLTANGGRYLFDNLTRRGYIVHLPRAQFDSTNGYLRNYLSVPGSQTNNTDDQLGEDGIDVINPAATGISTRVINLDFFAQPTDADTELGFDKTADNSPASKDANVNLTIDFGLYREVSLGNLVFFDEDSNGRANSNEGRDGVTVQLFRATDVPGVNSPLDTKVTANNGKYLFTRLRPNYYKVHIPASNFASGAPLHTMTSINQGFFGDDDVGEDGLNNTIPSTDGVSSSDVYLAATFAPTDNNGESGIDHNSDNDNDAAVDLTVDFGFQYAISIGNVVFVDGSNNNGRFDVGEGINGVTVQLFQSGQVPGVNSPMSTTTTANGGRYRFSSLNAGSYFVHLPYTNFTSGQPLFQKVSITGTGALDTDDDVGEDGIELGSPSTNGISSASRVFTGGLQPTNTTGESGFNNTEDDTGGQDVHGNMTIDFGFRALDPNAVGLGNAVFSDNNGNNRFDPGEGIDGVTVQLVLASTNQTLATTLTSAGGCYYFTNLAAGTYFVRLPASNFLNSGALVGKVPMPGQGGDNGFDDDLDENGDNPANPAVSGIRSTNIALAPGTEPTDAGNSSEFGKNTFIDADADSNNDLTVDFGFITLVGVGNVVFVDANGNGIADSGEGIGGVTVKLFTQGSDPLFDAAVATQTTDNTNANRGRFWFTGLQPGGYFLFIPPTMFTGTGPLLGKVSVPGADTGNADDNAGEDGIDTEYLTEQGIRSGEFTLTPGSLPQTNAEQGLYSTQDNGVNDRNHDLTKDFGFINLTCIGNLVFKDMNLDGHFTEGTDVGVPDVEVELWSASPITGSHIAVIATTITSSSGTYNFCVPAGTYRIHIQPTMFAPGAPLAYTTSTTASSVANQDDHLGQDAVDTGNTAVTGAGVYAFTTAVGTMPTAANGETGFMASADDQIDANSNLTIDLGFRPLSLWVGNLVFNDLNKNGMRDGTEVGIANVPVQLFAIGADPLVDTPTSTTTTAANGTYQLQALEEGQYFVHIPPAAFATGGPLFGLVSSVGFGMGQIDDNTDENGINFGVPTSIGVNASVISLVYNVLPVDNVGETGVFANIDNASDSNGDMTVDFGFHVPGPPSSQRIAQEELPALDATFAQLQAAQSGITLEQYAFGSSTTSPLQLVLGQTVDAHAAIASRPDLRFALESSRDFQHWEPLAIAPQSPVFVNGQRIVRYLGLPTAPLFVRLRADLDADLDGIAESSATTATQGYHTRTFAAGSTATFSMPLQKPLIAGERSAWTLAELLPPQRFQSSRSASTADRVQLYQNGSYQTAWVLATPQGPRWVMGTTLSDAGSTVIARDTGLLVQSRSTEIALTFAGEVVIDTVTPWSAANALLSTRALLPAAAPQGQPGDQVRIWLGDIEPTQSGFRTYTFGPQGWTSTDTAAPALQLQPFQAVFYQRAK